MNELARQDMEAPGPHTPLDGAAIEALSRRLGGHWKVVDLHRLECTYAFADFRAALAFVNQVGELAERAGHHPEIHLSYGRVKVTLWTHDVGGLSRDDFILAARIDEIEGASGGRR